MKRHLLVVAGLSVFALASARAQNLATSNCPTTTPGQVIAQDACQQAYDL